MRREMEGGGVNLHGGPRGEDEGEDGRRVVGLDEGGEAVQEAGKRGAQVRRRQHAACLDVRQKVRLRWLGRCGRLATALRPPAARVLQELEQVADDLGRRRVYLQQRRADPEPIRR
jgi:hypothetical protein